MKCASARLSLSRKLDDDLDGLEASALTQHVAGCTECSDHYQAIWLLKSQMSELRPPVLPEEAVSEILWARNRHAASEGDALILATLRRGLDYTYNRPKGFATVASFIITVSMYLLILGNMKGLPEWTAPGHSEPITISSTEFSNLNQLGLPAGGGLYSFPRIVEMPGLEESLQNAENRAVVVTLVNADGSASVLEVLSPRNRPDLAGRLASAIHQLSFRPAMSSGRPVTTQLILMLEKVEVRG